MMPLAPVTARLRADERGVAMVTSVLVMAVLTSLSLVAVQLTVHQGDQTSAERRRVQAVGAAEAGIDYVVKLLETTDTGSLPCANAVTGSLAPAPSVSTYLATVQYYSSYPPAGPAMTCPLSQNSFPRGALIRSTATTAGRAQSTRTMEALVRLEPVYGAFNHALLSDTSLTTVNSFQIEGNKGTDGDIYTNGNWTCSSSPVVAGSVWAQGSISMFNSCTVQGAAWANGNVTMDNTSLVGGDVTSSTGGLTLSSNAGYRVDGKATVLTSASRPEKVRGGVTTGKQSAAPPYQPFPVVNFVASDWQAAGYTVQTYTSCPSAKAFIAGLASTTTRYVVRITANCDLNWSTSDAVVTLGRDLAIVTDGSITVQSTQTFQSANPPGNTYKLYMMVPFTTSTGAAQTCSPTGTGNLNLTNQTNFLRLDVLFYTPCTANVANLTRTSGQVIARAVNVGNNFQLKFTPILLPNAGYITGNKVDIAYLREVTG